MRVTWKFNVHDWWMGAYWERDLNGLSVWVCILPFVPIKLRFGSTAGRRR